MCINFSIKREIETDWNGGSNWNESNQIEMNSNGFECFGIIRLAMIDLNKKQNQTQNSSQIDQ